MPLSLYTVHLIFLIEQLSWMMKCCYLIGIIFSSSVWVSEQQTSGVTSMASFTQDSTFFSPEHEKKKVTTINILIVIIDLEEAQIKGIDEKRAGRYLHCGPLGTAFPPRRTVSSTGITLPYH